MERIVLILSIAVIATLMCCLIGKLMSLGSKTDTEDKLNESLREGVDELTKGK